VIWATGAGCAITASLGALVERFAQQLWETWALAAAAVGKRIRGSLRDDWRQVIGVVGDVGPGAPGDADRSDGGAAMRVAFAVT